MGQINYSKTITCRKRGQNHLNVAKAVSGSMQGQEGNPQPGQQVQVVLQAVDKGEKQSNLEDTNFIFRHLERGV